jgi:hypothetical protein
VSFHQNIYNPLLNKEYPSWLYFKKESGMFMGKADHLGFLVGYIPTEGEPNTINKLVFVNCSSHYAEAEIIAGEDGIYKVPQFYNSHIVGSDSAFMCSNLEYKNIADTEAICNASHIQRVVRMPYSVNDLTLLLGVKRAVMNSVANSKKIKDSIVFVVDLLHR